MVTGTSIKSIEALAAGKPIIATQAAFRGLVRSPSSEAIIVADTADAFAQAMIETYQQRAKLSSKARDFYLAHLSNARYFGQWDAVLAEVPRAPRSFG
jgi:glycosyltransferase involved in cell wall biosynthesis